MGGLSEIKQAHLYIENGGDNELVSKILHDLHPEFYNVPDRKVVSYNVKEWPSDLFAYAYTNLITQFGIRLTSRNCLTQEGLADGKRIYLVVIKNTELQKTFCTTDLT
ncbi:MAG: hypothetical protein ACE5HI_02575 [bacterium]